MNIVSISDSSKYDNREILKSYHFAGRKVWEDRLQPGIYIRDGRKIVVR